MSQRIDFQTDPSKYRHWRVEYDGEIAKNTMLFGSDGLASLPPLFYIKAFNLVQDGIENAKWDSLVFFFLLP